MPHNKPTVIYLAGYGRSGTTLIDMVFNGHPRIFGAGGLGTYRTKDRRRMHKNVARMDKPCNCGQMVSTCPFWSDIFQGLDVEHGLGVYANPLAFILGRAAYAHHDGHPVDEPSYLALNEEIYRRIVRKTGKPVVFDATKIPFRAELLARSRGIDLHLLHVVRNGEACISSVKKQRPQQFFRPLAGWVKANLQVEAIRRRHPDLPYHFLRFEDFTSDPERELARVLGEMGIEFDQEMLRFRQHESHNFSGNAHRLDAKLPEKIRPVTGWEKRIKPHEHLLFAIAGRWMNAMYSRRDLRD